MVAPTIASAKRKSIGYIASCRLSEDEQWQAVLERDTRLDGDFVYAVLSTRIYCRPSCPSRKPARDQVIFFPVPEAARAAGFRSCRRCLPDQHPSADPQLGLVRQACRYIMDNSGAPTTLAKLAEEVDANPYSLQRVFKRIVGLTPRQFADACRWSDLKTNLKNGQSITHALYEAGYGSSSRLYEPASRQLGMTPGDYQRGAGGLKINYTVTSCHLGWVLIAATPKGVCAISLWDCEETLEEGLRQEFPRAEIQRDDQALGKWVHDVMEHLNGRLPEAEVPLDIQATAFQRLVWQELQRIPRGETRSYSQIARVVGRPKAARAVAQACSKNPVAVLIPCHRVVRADENLGGYRWGLERKQALLSQEGIPVETKVLKLTISPRLQGWGSR